MRRIGRVLTVLSTGVALLALTACGSVGPESERETTADSTAIAGEVTCSNVGEYVQNVLGDVAVAAESIVSDQQGFVEQLGDAASRLSEISGVVDDPELKQHVDDAHDAVESLVDLVSSGDVLGNMEQIGTELTKITEASTAMTDYCRGTA